MGDEPARTRVWFGVLFRPAAGRTFDFPALQVWAEQLLTDGATDDDMMDVLAGKGYQGDKLSWVKYVGSDTTPGYWGLAIASSVLDIRSAWHVDTGYPEDITEQWLSSMVTAGQILQLDSAKLGWFVTIS